MDEARVEDELEALESIIGPESFVRTGRRSISLTLARPESSMILGIHLPNGYPLSDPPVVSVGNDMWDAIVAGLLKNIWNPGDEVLYELYEALRELPGNDVGSSPSSNVAPTVLDDAAQPGQPSEHFEILFLDHMRDQKRYEKNLARMAAGAGVAVRVLHTHTDGHSASRPGGRGGGVDSRGVYLFVRGPANSVAAFNKQLRSEKVDVDSKGKSCFERQVSAVLAARNDAGSEPPEKAGGSFQNHRALFQGECPPPGSFGSVEVGAGMGGAKAKTERVEEEWVRLVGELGVSAAGAPFPRGHGEWQRQSPLIPTGMAAPRAQVFTAPGNCGGSGCSNLRGGADPALPYPRSGVQKFRVRVNATSCASPGIEELMDECGGGGGGAGSGGGSCAPPLLAVRLQAPPADGRANRELLEVVARHFGVPKSKVGLVRGHTSREKWISVDWG